MELESTLSEKVLNKSQTSRTNLREYLAHKPLLILTYYCYLLLTNLKSKNFVGTNRDVVNIFYHPPSVMEIGFFPL